MDLDETERRPPAQYLVVVRLTQADASACRSHGGMVCARHALRDRR
jgi:hypothetical protein